MGERVSSIVTLKCLLISIQCFQAVSLPREGKSLIRIYCNSSCELLQCLIVLVEPKIRHAFVVVINRVIRLYIDGGQMMNNCSVILFDGVQTSSYITVVGSYIWVDFDGLIYQLYLLFGVTKFASRFAFKVIKLAFLGYCKSLIAVIQEPFPVSKVEKSISGDKIFFCVIGH